MDCRHVAPQGGGSLIAKNGFRNEKEIAEKFNNWENDEEAKKWLQIMQYELNRIKEIKAYVISGRKTDVQVQVYIREENVLYAENIQIKLVSNKHGFNQIDKRWLQSYIELWKIPENIADILRHYVGEKSPKIEFPRDKRRMFADEFTVDEKKMLIEWLTNNKTLIVADVVRGRGGIPPEWIMVAHKTECNARWILQPINVCLNHYCNGDVEITQRGNIKIGGLTMQRKGGDNGAPTANMLQFKADPTELFNINI